MAGEKTSRERGNRELLSPEYLAEIAPIAWKIAISDWERGDPRPVAGLLRLGDPIPLEARKWLAELAEGKVKKNPGRPKKGLDLPQLAGKVMRELEIQAAFKIQLKIEQGRKFPRGAKMGSAKDRALEAVATRFKSTPDKVSQVVYPRDSGVKK
jgi:hypothetical protein